MTIQNRFAGHCFTPEMVQTMAAAYDEVLAYLGLDDPTDPIVDIVAKKIVTAAASGELNKQELAAIAVRDLGLSPG
jgi:hypothetical protein